MTLRSVMVQHAHLRLTARGMLEANSGPADHSQWSRGDRWLTRLRWDVRLRSAYPAHALGGRSRPDSRAGSRLTMPSFFMRKRSVFG